VGESGREGGGLKRNDNERGFSEKKETGGSIEGVTGKENERNQPKKNGIFTVPGGM